MYAKKSQELEQTAIRDWVDGRMIMLELTDGRIFGFSASRFKLLRDATDEQLREVSLRLNGFASRQGFKIEASSFFGSLFTLRCPQRCVVAPLREEKIIAQLLQPSSTARKQKESLTQRRNAIKRY